MIPTPAPEGQGASAPCLACCGDAACLACSPCQCRHPDADTADAVADGLPRYVECPHGYGANWPSVEGIPDAEHALAYVQAAIGLEGQWAEREARALPVGCFVPFHDPQRPYVAPVPPYTIVQAGALYLTWVRDAWHWERVDVVHDAYGFAYARPAWLRPT